MTVWLAIECPDCHSSEIFKKGKSTQGKQRFLGKNLECLRRTFILDNSHPRRSRKTKQQMVQMSLNGSGIRGTARVWHVGCPTLIRDLKKRNLT